MKQNRDILVLYSTAVCNLRCVYCYIDKNESLKKIDNILKESFEGDYYFNFAKNIFPKEQLREVQIWGGEPSIGLDRTYYTIEKLISYYPNLNRFMTSTNFTLPEWSNQFFGLLNVLGKFPKRKFHFSLQLSLDGPEDINDSSRGNGVTKAFKKNFDKLLSLVNKIPKNVHLNWNFKPTLDNNSILKLQTKKDIINYYSFFEEFYQKAQLFVNDNFSFGVSIPNTACPSPHTKQDGTLFANLCKLCREVEKDKIFNFYKTITPFEPREPYKHYSFTYEFRGGTCGTGRQVVGLLPYNMISTCHNGFCDLITDYKIESQKHLGETNTSLDFQFFAGDKKKRMTLTLEEFSKYELQIEDYYKPGTKTKMGNEAALINLLARVGQIDKKYIDRKEALEAAYFVQSCTSYCIRDNINSTGCKDLSPVGLYKLLLNGAREYIEGEEW